MQALYGMVHKFQYRFALSSTTFLKLKKKIVLSGLLVIPVFRACLTLPVADL